MALTQPIETGNVMYLYIIGGTLMQKSEQNAKGAVLRSYETSAGDKGEKWEIHHKSLTGFIEGIEFKDSDFGEQCVVKVTDGKDKAQLNLQTESRYFIDFAQKIANVDMNEPVTFSPFDFTNKETGKQIRGMSMVQSGKKIESYFYEKEKKKNINGIVEPENGGKGFKKDDWKIYFIQLKKFLVNHVKQQSAGIGKFEVKDEIHSFKPEEIDHLFPEVPENDMPF